MTIKLLKHSPGSVELRLEGRLDTTSAPAAQDAFLQIAGEYETIELNCAQLSYISSAGLRVLLVLQKQVNRTGNQLCLTNVKPSIMEVFEMTGFSGILRIN